jgi:hypothetical protein
VTRAAAPGDDFFIGRLQWFSLQVREDSEEHNGKHCPAIHVYGAIAGQPGSSLYPTSSLQVSRFFFTRAMN